jgi:hypothetical protein
MTTEQTNEVASLPMESEIKLIEAGLVAENVTYTRTPMREVGVAIRYLRDEIQKLKIENEIYEAAGQRLCDEIQKLKNK